MGLPNVPNPTRTYILFLATSQAHALFNGPLSLTYVVLLVVIVRNHV